jgi:hypothetical protein
VIGLLHTAASNAPLFDAALERPEVELRHLIRPELLEAAEAAGGLTPAIAERTAAALRDAAQGAGAVLLTCSTLGPVAEEARLPVPVLRADAALAREAVAGGGRVAVLYAAPTTREATERLFLAAARGTGATIALRAVAGAWDAFRAGDTARYHALVAEAAEEALASGADRVALAQASMAGAAGRVRGGVPLTSPAAGLRAALAALGR